MNHTHREVSLLVLSFTFFTLKRIIPSWVFSTVFKMYKWYQVTQSITYTIQQPIRKIKLHDLKHNAHKILSSLLLTTPRIWPTPLLLYFFRNPYFWQHPFNDIAPVEYRIKTKINPWEKVVSCLEDYIIILNSFLYKTLL